MNYSEAIIFHFGPGVADFHYDMSEKLHWVGPGEKPTVENFELWENERVKAKELTKQEKTLLNLIKKHQYHLNTKRKKFIPDIPTWELKMDKWDDQLELVRDQIELMNEGKEFSLIAIEPEPDFVIKK